MGPTYTAAAHHDLMASQISSFITIISQCAQINSVLLSLRRKHFLRCDKQQPAARADQFAQKLILSLVDERRTAGIKLLIRAAAQKLNGSVHLHHTDRSQLASEYQWWWLDFFPAFKAMTISLNKNDGCSSLASLFFGSN
jgi:hypothetical protein